MKTIMNTRLMYKNGTNAPLISYAAVRYQVLPDPSTILLSLYR
ncbi:hypothetical protein [Porphyromonas loveana]